MNENKKLKIVGIVQARMRSERLPNKAMLWLHGLPIIGWLEHRLQKSKELACVVFAVSDSSCDRPLISYLQEQKAKVFCGSQEDVLERIYKAALHFQATHVVRICADNPFTDAQEIDHLVRFYLNGDYDYAYNHIPKQNKYPDGLGGEMVSIEVLEYIYKNAKSPPQREHAFNYIWDNQEQFKIGTFDPTEVELQYPELRFDVDTYEQYLNLLQMDLNLDMPAKEIVECFRRYFLN